MQFSFFCRLAKSINALIMLSHAPGGRGVRFEHPSVVRPAACLYRQYPVCFTPVVLLPGSCGPPFTLPLLSGSAHFRHPPNEIFNWAQAATWAHGGLSAFPSREQREEGARPKPPSIAERGFGFQMARHQPLHKSTLWRLIEVWRFLATIWIL